MQLVEPTACTPAAGWEKGQVENQAGLARERFFTPRLRFASYEELSDVLLDDACARFGLAARRDPRPCHQHRVDGIEQAAVASGGNDAAPS